MFRITRGMHVQHIYFPVPVIGIRGLDPADGAEPPAAPDASLAESTAPLPTRGEAADDAG